MKRILKRIAPLSLGEIFTVRGEVEGGPLAPLFLIAPVDTSHSPNAQGGVPALVRPV